MRKHLILSLCDGKIPGLCIIRPELFPCHRYSLYMPILIVFQYVIIVFQYFLPLTQGLSAPMARVRATIAGRHCRALSCATPGAGGHLQPLDETGLTEIAENSQSRRPEYPGLLLAPVDAPPLPLARPRAPRPRQFGCEVSAPQWLRRWTKLRSNARPRDWRAISRWHVFALPAMPAHH